MKNLKWLMVVLMFAGVVSVANAQSADEAEKSVPTFVSATSNYSYSVGPRDPLPGHVPLYRSGLTSGQLIDPLAVWTLSTLADDERDADSNAQTHKNPRDAFVARFPQGVPSDYEILYVSASEHQVHVIYFFIYTKKDNIHETCHPNCPRH